MIVSVPRLNRAELRNITAESESSEIIRKRVEAARNIQLQRQHKGNALIESKAFDQHCALSDADAALIDEISEKLKLSLRSHVRVIKLARTIADLAEQSQIETEHLVEAVSYRNNSIAN